MLHGWRYSHIANRNGGVAQLDTSINRVALGYAQEVKKQYPIKSAYLYGSHAMGTAHENSDIDIAFIVEPMDEKNYYSIFGELFNIAANFTANIEPNLLVDDGDYCKYSFLAEVMETGQRLEV